MEKPNNIIITKTFKESRGKVMKIDVQNNVPNLEVNVNQDSNGIVTVVLNQKENKTLGSISPGETVTIGEHEYIVLSQSEETTAIISKSPLKTMSFGGNGDYTKSNVRNYCNGEFYDELCKAVGKNNIIPHTVRLVSEDGSNKGWTVKDDVSILTCNLYRRYREFIPTIDSSWWTATRVTTLNESYARDVCYVNSCGILNWDDCDYSSGVRPFCILKSSILV